MAIQVTVLGENPSLPPGTIATNRGWLRCVYGQEALVPRDSRFVLPCPPREVRHRVVEARSAKTPVTRNRKAEMRHERTGSGVHRL